MAMLFHFKMILDNTSLLMMSWVDALINGVTDEFELQWKENFNFKFQS